MARFNTAAGEFSSSLGDAFRSFLGRGATERAARRAEEKALAEQFRLEQQGRKFGAESALLEDKRSALGTVGADVAPLLGAFGIGTETAAPAFGALARAGQGNAEQLGQLVATLLEQGRRSQAVETADPARADVLLSAGGATPVRPFTGTASGGVLNRSTGAIDLANPLAQANVASQRALAGQREATGGLAQIRGDILAEQAPIELDRIRAQTALAQARGGLAGALTGSLGTGTVPLTPAKRAEFQNEIADIDTGINALDRSLTAIAQGTGIGSSLQSAMNFLTGQAQSLGVPLSAPFPDTADARQTLRVLERELVRTLATNPRFPVAEQEVIRRLIPSPDDFFGDPLNAMQRLRSLREFVVSKRSDLSGQLGVTAPEDAGDFSSVISILPLDELLELEPELMSDIEREALSRRLDALEQGSE